MNKVITINLNGNAYQLEEGGFDALRAYLDSAGRSLERNPDRDEIIADIEQAIADKFRSLLGASKTVIVAKEVADIIAEMGPVEAASDATDGAQPGGRGPSGAAEPDSPPPPAAAPAGTPRRLYKVHDGAMLGGVCNGLAAYFNIDVTIVRVVFAVLTFAYGSGALLYVLLMVILPSATTSAEKAAAHGATSATAEEFIRRARAGYYEGMKAFGDKRAHREWKRRFKREMKGWRWRFHQQYPGAHYPVPGAPLSYPVASFLHGLLKILFILCIITLFTSHSLLGFWIPFGMPSWVALIFLIVVYKFVSWPLKVLLYGYGAHGGPGPFGFLWCVLKWVLIVWFILWLLGGHQANLHEAIEHLPPKLHHAAQSVRDWWDQQ